MSLCARGCDFVDMVWNCWTIPKHQLISWLILRDVLLTPVRLKRFGVTDSDSRCICESAAEMKEHLFFDCRYSCALISEAEAWLNIRLPRPVSLLQCWRLGDRNFSGK